MSEVLGLLAAEVVDAKLERYRERTAIPKTARINACMERDLPYEDSDSSAAMTGILGVLHEIANRPQAGSDSGGANSGAVDASAGAKSSQGDSAEANRRSAGTASGAAEGETSQGNRGTDAGTSQSHPASTGGGGAGRAWLRAALPWVVGTALGAGPIVGGVAGWWLNRNTDSGAVEPPVAVERAEYPLLDWLRENSHHLPPQDAE